MPVTIEMSVSESVDPEEGDIPDTSTIQAWADKACMHDDQFVTSVQVVSSTEMRELNHTWRGKDTPTNVLSFPVDSTIGIPDEPDVKILGDLALCSEVINTEAEQQRKSKQAHWAHMVVHGMLHLQGYDHIEDKQAEAMESVEVKILHQLGFPDPYEAHQ